MQAEALLMATGETLYMVFVSVFFAALGGIPLGIFLYFTKYMEPKPLTHNILGFLINVTRSVPFIILLVLMIPFTRVIVGTSIGTTASIVPLSLAAIPFLARLVEGVLKELPFGLLETGRSMGASNFQIIWRILLKEARPGVLGAITITVVNLIGYSAMAGAVGGGGLGDLAIRHGYQRFDTFMMVSTVIILVVFVQFCQYLGDILASKFQKK